LGASGLDDLDARHMLILIHSGPSQQEFVLPALAADIDWRTFIDTFATSPNDIFPEVDGPPPPVGPIRMEHHSLLCFVASSNAKIITSAKRSKKAAPSPSG
jgi:glycogen operon protein